jgi:hypothetical protein
MVVLTVLLDRKEIKRQKDKEIYASMSREQKDEVNRKARERRADKKRRDHESKFEEDAYCMAENTPNGTLEQGTNSFLVTVWKLFCYTILIYLVSATKGLHNVWMRIMQRMRHMLKVLFAS